MAPREVGGKVVGGSGWAVEEEGIGAAGWLSGAASPRPKIWLAALETEREGPGLLRSLSDGITALPGRDLEWGLEASRRRPKTERGRSMPAPTAAGVRSEVTTSSFCKSPGVTGRERGRAAVVGVGTGEGLGSAGVGAAGIATERGEETEA